MQHFDYVLVKINIRILKNRRSQIMDSQVCVGRTNLPYIIFFLLLKTDHVTKLKFQWGNSFGFSLYLWQ